MRFGSPVRRLFNPHMMSMNIMPARNPRPKSGLIPVISQWTSIRTRIVNTVAAMSRDTTTTTREATIMKSILGFFVALLMIGAAQTAGAATILPPGKSCFYDENGAPLAAGTINFYIPSTTTPKDTWQDADENTLNTNPVHLDSSGCAIIYGDGVYREVLKDVDGNLIWDQLTASTGSGGGGSLLWGGVSTGSANTQTITVSGFTATDGQIVSFTPGFTNTGAMTLNAGTGNIAVRKDTLSGPVALAGGEVRSGNVVLALYYSGFFQLINVPPASTDYQVFTTSGAWTKPSWAPAYVNAYTDIQCWGAGGGGGANAFGGGGGGGAYVEGRFLTSALTGTVTVTIPTGGAVNTAGGNATFGSYLTAYGGGAGSNSSGGSGGGGGGWAGAGVDGPSGGAGGAPAATSGIMNNFGGGAGGVASVGINSVLGGGGGSAGNSSGSTVNGGYSIAGGGGGSGAASSGTPLGGTSTRGGAGGAPTIAGSAPGGGGGRNAAGARGECRVWTTP